MYKNAVNFFIDTKRIYFLSSVLLFFFHTNKNMVNMWHVINRERAIYGCISFVCSRCAEHVLANEVVRNTLREQTEQCAGCTKFWGGAEGIKMAEPTIFSLTYNFFTPYSFS